MDIRTAWFIVATAWLWREPLAPAQGTWRVSVDAAGNEGNNYSGGTVLSANGRFVAFSSGASNLVPGDGNQCWDVFVRDRRAGTITRVSVDSAGNQGYGDSAIQAISPDGRWVAFRSEASNLVPGDTNRCDDIFVHDRLTGVTTRASVDSAGNEGDSLNGGPEISADGRFVAFDSLSRNLVPGDTNGYWDAFVHDDLTGVTTRVSVSSTGQQGDQDSYRPKISADGRFVAFESYSTNLVANDTNGRSDLFLHDRQTGTTIRVSVDDAGNEANGDSYWPSLSADDRFLAFHSFATNLVPGDRNGRSDVFVRDLLLGLTRRVSVDAYGGEADGNSVNPRISADGLRVAFTSDATNLVPGDVQGIRDVFLRDLATGTTTRVSVDTSGLPGNDTSTFTGLSADGRFVAFESVATNLVANDTNWSADAFVHGPYLTLEAEPEEVVAGDTLVLTEWTGQPGAPTLLAAVAVDGTPTWIRIRLGRFDPVGRWVPVSAVVPPGLAGHVATFLGFGFAPDGTLETTGPADVTFR